MGRVRTLIAHADTIAQRVAAAAVRCESLERAILAKAFRGKLSAREPEVDHADYPAVLRPEKSIHGR